jgi:hypothetical protein
MEAERWHIGVSVCGQFGVTVSEQLLGGPLIHIVANTEDLKGLSEGVRCTTRPSASFCSMPAERLESLRTASGLICATSDPASNRMWAYYGDSHRGVCIGYSTAFFPFRIARAVRYADPDPDAPLDLLDTLKIAPLLLSDNVSCRKGTEWAFEKEYHTGGTLPKRPHAAPADPSAGHCGASFGGRNHG